METPQKNTDIQAEINVNESFAAVTAVQSTLENFLDTATVEHVYGPSYQQDNNLIIPAAEVFCAMGFGAGYGAGGDPNEENAGSGGGGGGGGHTFSRPVAVIIANQNGVHVEPVVDATKIALAFFTTFGFVFSLLTKMKKGNL